jgi:hypothetical protein
MKTYVHFLSYLAQFFLELKMFETKVVEKIKTHILVSVIFFRKSCRLWDNVDKYCTVEQVTDDIWSMRFACWVTKATDTHPQYLIPTDFPLQHWFRELAAMLRCTYVGLLVTHRHIVAAAESAAP